MAKENNSREYVAEKVLEAEDKKGQLHEVAVLRSKDGRIIYTNLLGPIGKKWFDSLRDYKPPQAEEDDVEF